MLIFGRQLRQTEPQVHKAFTKNILGLSQLVLYNNNNNNNNHLPRIYGLSTIICGFLTPIVLDPPLNFTYIALSIFILSIRSLCLLGLPPHSSHSRLSITMAHITLGMGNGSESTRRDNKRYHTMGTIIRVKAALRSIVFPITG